MYSLKTHNNCIYRQTWVHVGLGMGTETRYLIGLWAKLWKTGVSICSDVNGSAIGTGEIKKTRIHLLLLYIHIILQILSHQSHQLFLCAIIFKHLSDAFLLFAIQIALTWMSSARATWKPCLCYKRELTRGRPIIGADIKHFTDYRYRPFSKQICR